MSAKAAPKSFNQLRNVCYLFAGIAGAYQGFFERQANNNAWDTYRKEQWKAAYDKQEAAAAEAKAIADAKNPPKIPSEIPEGLHGVYTSLTQGN
jgi:hypothetical protein